MTKKQKMQYKKQKEKYFLIRDKKLKEYLQNPNYCLCGCNKIVMPDFNRKGFYLTKYIHEHKRIYTKGMKHTEETKIKISKKNSGNVAWNKGLTKYDNEIIMQSSKRMKIHNPSFKKEVVKKIHIKRKQNGTDIIGGQKSLKTKIKNGTLGSGGKCKWHQYSGKKVQGKFELKFAKFLDSVNIKWISHKDIETFKYIGLDGKQHYYQPDFKDSNGVYYDPHAKYYWDENFEHKINEVKKDNSDKVFIVFNEDNYIKTCKQIKDRRI